MKQLIQNSRTGELKVMNVPDPQCNDNGVLVKTLHSVISTGTERLSTQTAKASLIGKAKLRPDLVEKAEKAIREALELNPGVELEIKKSIKTQELQTLPKY